MRWLIRSKIDGEGELQKRMEFYSQFRKRELIRELELEARLDGWCHVFNDGNEDNRYMLVGHTDFAVQAIRLIKQLNQRRYRYHKFFICACIMSYEIFYSESYLSTLDEVYVTEQVLEDIEDTLYYTCEFLDKASTRIGFGATKSELRLLTSEAKSFYGNLKRCFVPLGEYRNAGATTRTVI